ncbi:MAG TPA: hypothetical protein VGM87_06735 [Roseomonas sp.]
MRDHLVPLSIWIALILSVAALDVILSPGPTGAPPVFAVTAGR